MRLIDTEVIKIPTSMIQNINGCYMIRVEDVQRIISEQPTAFDKEKVIEKLEGLREKYFLTIANTGDEKLDLVYQYVWNALDHAIGIVDGRWRTGNDTKDNCGS